MTIGAQCAALACFALGLPLSGRPLRAWQGCLAALVCCACVAASLPVSRAYADMAIRICLLTAIGNAAATYPPWKVSAPVATIASAFTGIAAGAAIAAAGAPLEIAQALPCTLAAGVLAHALRAHAAVAVRVVASWLIAIALLALLLQFLPMTPGYLPDHID